MRREGRDIKMQVRREGDDMGMMVSLSYLNYSRVERAPTVDFGFIPQQLPGDGGVRVGHVTDDSSAEKAGLVIGDRIVSIDSELVPTYDKFMAVIGQKAPGDLLMINVTRDGTLLELSFILQGEGVTQSDVAKLSGKLTQSGQVLTCLVSIDLPVGKHIYSAHSKGLGQPTRVKFRGHGYRLIGDLEEPPPRLADRDWILEGNVELRQKIQITDPDEFQLVLSAYAQICDDISCHEFRAIVVNEGADEHFIDYRGDFEQLPNLPD